MEYLLHPIALWAGLTMGLCGSLTLFLSLKSEAARQEARRRKILDALDTRWRCRVEALERSYHELAEVTQFLVPPTPPRSGLNFSKRSQALQMHRRGESADRIATTLSLPRNEIDLLLKIHGILLSNLGAGPPGRSELETVQTVREAPVTQG